MTRLRYDHILAGTALVLILAAIPAGSLAQNADKTAPLPAAASPAEQQATEAPSANPTLAEPTVAVDPIASLDPADRPVAEKIRDFFTAISDRIFTNKKERAAAEAFYLSRNYAPLWLDKGIENARANSAIARLKNADADGLEVSDYKIPTFAGLAPEALAEADLKLTQTVLTYARHVQAGRFPYTRVSRNIELPQAAPEPADILNAVAATQDAGKGLNAFSPQHEEYRKLKAMLAELRGAAGAKKGDTSRQIETILVNMERWRWYPRDLGSAHVIVNQPDFTLRVMHDGAQVWTTRIVIGKPSMPTPLLSETMKFITVNPTWHVPPSIVHNEYLPALAQDPTVLSRMGLRVSYSGGGVSISQPPGPGNALGRIRFQLPQPLPGLSARHPGQVLLRPRGARLQPRLHARAGSGKICRGSPQHRPPRGALDGGSDHADVRQRRAEPAAAADAGLGAPHLSDRLRRQRRQAANAPRHLQSR